MTAVLDPRLSVRLNEVGFSEIVIIRNQILDLQATGRTVFQFHGGEPFPNTPEFVKEACARAMAENKTRYAPSSGIAPLLDAIQRKVETKNRIPASVEDCIVVNGGMHGLSVAFQTVVDPGDEVIVFSPYWTPIRDLVTLAGGRAVRIDAEQARRDGVGSALRRAVSNQTRVLYLNSPSNPAGMVWTKEELHDIASVCFEHGLVVISDEAYEDLVYDGEHVSIASLDGMADRTITVFTLSKSYAMTGWRIGYVIAPPALMGGLRRLVLNTTNGVNTPTQWAAVAALTASSNFLDDARLEYRRRRDLLAGGLNELGLFCSKPAGAFYTFPDCSPLGSKSWDVSALILERAGVSTVPGVVFGPEGEGHLRFCFSTSTDEIERALDSLRRNL